MHLSALDWQKEIYLKGFAGTLSAVPVAFEELERKAKEKMSSRAYAYIAGGAGSGATMNSNRSAFDSWQIVPRMLRDVSMRDQSIELFGRRLPTPFLIAPIGVLEMVHDDADLAVARAAAQLGVPYIFSNQASFSIEACAKQMQLSPRWFQLYWSKNRELVSSFVRRAESCGCEAIVITLDTTMLGWRTRDLDAAYLPFLEGKGIAQYTSDPVFLRMLEENETSAPEKRTINWETIRGLISMVNKFPGKGFIPKLKSGKPMAAVRTFISTYSNPSTTWDDLRSLRAETKLPILLKGILHPDDARKALEYGMNGIIVSNHGGRQVDGSISTMQALPKVIEAVSAQIPVLIDSGIRSGADAFKAIALGAKAVCIGRPYVYGLTIAGERGVFEVLQNHIAEFELTMGLSGCTTVNEIDRSCLVSSK